MEAVSPAQFEAATTGGMPEPEAIGDCLWSVPMPMPGGFLAYSLCTVHLGADGAVTVVDPGWGSAGSLERLDGFLRFLGSRVEAVTTIVVTHSHPDHIGLADAVRDASGAALLLARREQESLDADASAVPGDIPAHLVRWGVPLPYADALLERLSRTGPRTLPRRGDVLLEDGDRLPVAGEEWTVLATPGHTPGHLCIVDHRRGILFSGDHVLPTVFPGVGLGADTAANPVGEYLNSLERLQPYDDYEVIPGHGYRFRGLGGRRRAAAEHALRRAREVGAVIEAQYTATTWEVASRLTWTGGWQELIDGVMLYSGLRQTEMYREFVLAGGLSS